MPVTTDLAIITRTPFTDIKNICLSMNKERLGSSVGLNHATHERGYSPDALKTVDQHLDALEAEGHIEVNSYTIVESCRNLINNMRCFAYFGDAEYFCANQNELPLHSERPYYGLMFLNDGTIKSECVDFRQVPMPTMPVYLTGTPVLWNDDVCDLETLCVEAGDSAHVWKLERSEPLAIELASIFENTRHAPADIAAAELIKAANNRPRQDSYLHHAIGVDSQALYSIIAVGPLERIGQIAKDAGASSAIVVDNGGSVSLSLRRPGQKLRTLYESWYFREPAVAVIAYQLNTDINDRVPFNGFAGHLNL